MRSRASPSFPARSRAGRALLASAGVMAAGLAVRSLSGTSMGFMAGSTSAQSEVRQQLRRGLLGRKFPAITSSALGGDVEDDRRAAKAELLDYLDDEGLAQEVQRPEGKPTRGRLDEVIYQLERYSPTWDPVYSEGIDGDWEVKYAASYAPGLLSSPTRELALFLYSGGYSLGSALSSFASGFWGQTLGLEIKEKKVTIDGGRDVQATAVLTSNNVDLTLKYAAELLPLSGNRMSEEVMSFELAEPVGKQDMPFELRRTILITYLDDDLMIVRDESGVPEVLARTVVPFTSEAPAIMEKATGNSSDVANSSVTMNPTLTSNASMA